MQKIIEICNGVTRHPLYRMKEPVNLTIGKGEQVAIVGPNGGGKSMLVDIIIGRHPLLMNEVRYDFSPSRFKLAADNIKYITFRDSYGDFDANYYYQQRWNQHDIDDTPVVADLLNEAFLSSKEQTERAMTDEERCADQEEREVLRKHLYGMFHLEALLDKHIILLSSGELRKFQLTKTLLANPRVLVMDNPFIGLDASTRDQLAELLRTLTEQTDLQVILVLSKTDGIPDFITHVVAVSDMTVGEKQTLECYRSHLAPYPSHVLSKEKEQRIVDLPCGKAEYHADVVARFNHVSIRYGERTILKDLDLTVHNGERWALSGQNGAGKSTLLSLVCADNPQSYACDIELFGNKRGSGESIWDIKKHIGYVSPEMHRAYLKDLPAIEIVASGLSDSIGLYARPKADQLGVCLWWMDIFGIADLKDRTFLKLSSGEQRLCLLTRAFVKDPELLILDEPLHGLDMVNRRMVKDIIEAFCRRPNKTLIMVTHYKEELPDVIDHSLFLKRQ